MTTAIRQQGRNYSEFIAWKRRQCGSQFVESDLAKQFVPYFESGQRIEVDMWGKDSEGKDHYGHTIIRGTVGVTTGWRPVFVLMRRRSDRGSSWTLGEWDHVIKIVN